MVPIAMVESTVPAASGSGGDPLCRVVHVALAIYLLPVVAIVCLIGGASIVIGSASRVVARLASVGPGVGSPAHSAFAGPSRLGLSPRSRGVRQRARVRLHR